MARPIILTVDDDVAVSQAISRDLRARYGDRYRIVRANSGAEALATLEELAQHDLDVALIVSDHRMPEMTGIELLERSKPLTPGTKRVLLTAYADTDVAIKAINDIGLDHYLMKPWAPPEDRLYPVLDDLLDAWDHANDRFEGVRVVGNKWSERSYDTRMFLARNHVAYQWLELERDAEAQRLFELFDGEGSELPLIVMADGSVLRGATVSQIADALGLSTRAESALYDVVVVGAGPAGLAAAVYASSEGLRVAVIERDAPGGQAGQSARIENYLGFPNGLSGSDLSHRAATQARRLGAEMVLARSVEALEHRGNIDAVIFDDGSEIEARAIIVATGDLLPAPRRRRARRVTGRGVFYGASANDSRATTGDDVYIVGAANSAGRPRSTSPCREARRAPRPRRLARRRDVSVPRPANPGVGQHRGTPPDRGRPGTGTDHLETLTIVDHASGKEQGVARTGCSCSSGPFPAPTGSASTSLVTTTGSSSPAPTSWRSTTRLARWPLERQPSLLETSVPGVFAAGDVRRSSMKRVASAVGEGSSSVSNVHLYLETI